MNLNETQKIIAVIKVTFQHKFDVIPETASLWHGFMQDLDARTVEQVVYDWCRDEEWPPAPGTIRDRVRAATSPLPGAESAWIMVHDRIRATYPGHEAPEWDAPAEVQEAAKAIGGLRAIRMSEKPNDMSKRFKEVYRGIIARTEREQREALNPENSARNLPLSEMRSPDRMKELK